MTQASLNNSPDRAGRTQNSWSERMKPVMVLAVAGTLGMGIVWLGRSLWNTRSEQAFLPLEGETSQFQRPLRDRVPILTPNSAPRRSPGSAARNDATGEARENSTQDTPAARSGRRASAAPQSPGLSNTAPASNAETEEPSTDAEEESADTAAIAPASPQSSPPSGSADSSRRDRAEMLAMIAELLQPPEPFQPAPDTIAARPAPVQVIPQGDRLQPLFRPQPLPIPSPSAPAAPNPTNSEPDNPEPTTPDPSRPVPSTPELRTPEPSTSEPSTPEPSNSEPSRPAPSNLEPRNSEATQPEAVTPTPSRPAPVPSEPNTPELRTPEPSTVPTVPVPTPNATATITPATPTAPSSTDSIYVDRLRITGNTRFSTQELMAAARGNGAIAGTPAQAATVGGTKPASETPSSPDPTLFNRRLTPAELVQMSEAITKLYTERGYINSGAYVPAEVLNGAAPEIRVVEGKLEAINVQVEPAKFRGLGSPLSRAYVRRRLARNVRSPLNVNQLVDVVKLLEQDPLIDSISTKLEPGTTQGGSVLDVRVRQAAPVDLTLSIDNGRTPTVGRFRQQASLTQANLLGLGDRLQVSFNRSEGSRSWNLGYSLPINAKDGILSFNYTNSRGEVITEPFRELDIKSRSQNFELALRQPIRRTSTSEFALTLRGTHYRSNGVFLETFNDGVPLPFPASGSDDEGNTRVTALRFGQEWVQRSERDVVSLQSELSFGLNALNSTVLDTAPDGRFFSWQARGLWVHSFGRDTLLAVRGQLQLADRPLVPVEQISLGGLESVRGYQTSTLLADSGWFASVEAYLPLLRVKSWNGVLQVVPFFDIGQGWNRGIDQPNPDRLMSTGLGLQWKMGDNFRARLDWGIPLINATTENGRSLREGLFFSVTFSP